ncbi:MAG: anhydro-N-acetylmuramic acid kinase [Pseudomonadota bacterium]
MRALGLMSGTSMDGIDAAILESDGETLTGIGATAYEPYSEEDRAVIRAAMAAATSIDDRHARPGPLADAEIRVTERHAEVVRQMIDRVGPIDVIGFHGQTVFHAPDRHLTIQIGDGQRLAEAAGVPVIFDLRADDVAAGGEGAPLAPVYHRAVARHAGLALPAAIVNIGGVANVTWIGPDGTLAAFDTGPGNALMDDWMRRRTGERFDADGLLAGRGKVSEQVLARLLDHPYFALSWPKSLDRDAFSLDPVAGLSLEDGMATLSAFTVETVAQSLELVPQIPVRVIVTGGGAHNPTLIANLQNRLGLPVDTMNSTGFDADFIEAQAFAYCAIRSLRGLPITFPGTTGAPRPLTGGIRVDPNGDGD